MDSINLGLNDDIRMSGLPNILRIADGPEKLPLPPASLPVAQLIKFQLPPQRKSTVYADPTDYLSDLCLTITTFNVTEIVAPPSVVVKALGRLYAGGSKNCDFHAILPIP
ncbi:hypothetical protein B0H19DRAFT_1234659 [Mycena capillaripes]|nr:hypothetical protein B0H19DRAFT_1234659 [Mycena capillaripes]